MKYVIGISAYYHDSSACLVNENGEILSAVQEERFSRIKHDNSFPIETIKFFLSNFNISPQNIEAIVFYEKPFLKFERLLETYVNFFPKGFFQFLKSIPIWAAQKLFQENEIKKNLLKLNNNFKHTEIFFSDHHLSHAASAFFPTKFNKAAILTADGVGEWRTTTIGIGENNNIKILKEINFPHSIGLLYSAFTYYCGFKVNDGEYKLMGLAPYGKPIYEKIIKENVINIKEDGSFWLNSYYFEYPTGFKMINKNFENLFSKPARKKDEKIDTFYMDIAASIQKITEEILLKISRMIKINYDIENICLAGGVALNCVCNGILKKNNIFKNIWIQPAAGDAGGSLGAALSYIYMQKKRPRNINILESDSMKGSLLGPEIKSEDAEKKLIELGANFSKLDTDSLNKFTAMKLSEGKLFGWFQGKMEFGPRALGNRSILADPRNQNMKKKLNMSIKFREDFRPFAPAVLEEKVSEWFDFNSTSPYMQFVANVRKDKNENQITIPAVTHVDNSARLQTVNKDINPRFYNLINEFYQITNVPILINTSFNINNEPIVNTIEDAYQCFLTTELDYLVCGNLLIDKNNQFQK